MTIFKIEIKMNKEHFTTFETFSTVEVEVASFTRKAYNEFMKSMTLDWYDEWSDSIEVERYIESFDNVDIKPIIANKIVKKLIGELDSLTELVKISIIETVEEIPHYHGEVFTYEW